MLIGKYFRLPYSVSNEDAVATACDKPQPSSVTIFPACKKIGQKIQCFVFLLVISQSRSYPPAAPSRRGLSMETSCKMFPGPQKVWFLP